jgi:hypothetical protein
VRKATRKTVVTKRALRVISQGMARKRFRHKQKECATGAGKIKGEKLRKGPNRFVIAHAKCAERRLEPKIHGKPFARKNADSKEGRKERRFIHVMFAESRLSAMCDSRKGRSLLHVVDRAKR